MKFEVSKKSLDLISTDIIVFFLFQQKGKKSSFVPTKLFDLLDKKVKGQLSLACQADKFTGKVGEKVSFFTSSMIPATKILVIGLGEKEKWNYSVIRKALGSFASSHKNVINSAVLTLPEIFDEKSFDSLVIAMTESMLLGSYQFVKYKEKKKEERVFELTIFASDIDEKKVKKAIEKGELYAKATTIARDLINEQASVATPTYLADLANDIAKSSSAISCRIIEKKEAEKLGFDAFLGIARASDTPPKFIVLEYKPKKSPSKKKLALIGKGITFDSGGINVKPGDHMQDMKMDMSGAALVLGVFSVLAQIEPSFEVMGVIAATPNLISGKGVVPGDVVRAYNGKTIEILNTDAEGRVTMADSLSYAVKQGATEIMDFATLTGACLVALGEDIAAIFANEATFGEKVKEAAKKKGEKVWELPLDEDYKSMNKSEVADIANIPNSRYGGTITAALFLQEFVNKVPWIHFDIAGPAFASRPSSLGPKGGTGFGVRTVLQYIEEESKK
ncbi:MAG: leucyl aminopeptidase [Candidatus Levybacteria bacterium]|nr:leucyl aminopeptidase [Candidatus Levybacteria bacterium]